MGKHTKVVLTVESLFNAGVGDRFGAIELYIEDRVKLKNRPLYRVVASYRDTTVLKSGT